MAREDFYSKHRSKRCTYEPKPVAKPIKVTVVKKKNLSKAPQTLQDLFKDT